MVILGGGESGVGAALLAKQHGYDVFLSDGGKLKEIYKKELQDIQGQMASFLQNYRVQMHPNKTKIFRTEKVLTFLGHRAFLHFRLLKRENVLNFKRKLRKMLNQHKKGLLEGCKMEEKIQCWVAHASFSHTYRLQSKIFAELAAQGIYLTKVESLSRRLLEQQ